VTVTVNVAGVPDAGVIVTVHVPGFFATSVNSAFLPEPDRRQRASR
jgi:hypothetical protein